MFILLYDSVYNNQIDYITEHSIYIAIIIIIIMLVLVFKNNKIVTIKLNQKQFELIMFK